MQDRYAFDDLIRGKSAQELQAFHTQLLLAIVRNHGAIQAMGIVGTSMQWLATMSNNRFAIPMPPPSSPKHSYAESEHETAQQAVARRWQDASRKALLAPDPWQMFGLRQLPLERAQHHRLDPLTQTWSVSDLLVRMERTEFDRGAMRLCYRMRTEPHGRLWVAKKYEKEPESMTTLQSDIIMQMRAKEYAKRFNACAPPKQVDVVEASIVQIPARPEGSRNFAVEAFLQGNFTKHSSNSGFVADDVIRHTPHAFAHFSFESSESEEIVVDIQGVDDLYTDPQIHTAHGARYGRGDMGLRGMALFFASHRCNSVCRQMGLTVFSHSPVAGDSGAATESHEELIEFGSERQPTQELVLAPPRQKLSTTSSCFSEKPTMYARVHLALAMLHARHVQAGDDFIGHNVLASPAQGLFHLRIAALQGSASAMFTIACLHLHVRPRKGVMRALSSSLQRPLVQDEAAALPYIVRAAETGIASAMAAAGYAYEKGCGCKTSAILAVRWYRANLAARSNEDRVVEEELEREGERLPGGSAREDEILAALANLYENGDEEMEQNPRLAWQFYLLARSRARRDEDAAGESSDDSPS